MDNSVQVQIDKMKVDIKTLMSAVKKLVLEQRQLDKNIEILDGNMKKLKKEKEKPGDTAEIEDNLKLIQKSNGDMSLVVNTVSEKLNQIDVQVVKNVEHLKNIDLCMNNSREKVGEISDNEPVEISVIKDKLKVLDDKIERYDREIKAIETSMKEKSTENIKVLTKNSTSKNTCQYCEIKFESNYKLETHLMTHQEANIVKCDSCEKSFFSTWRLKVHKKGHGKQRKRCCHYFNNQIECPFEKIGCKFEHIPSNKCRFGSQCEKPKCQFQHQEKTNNI